MCCTIGSNIHQSVADLIPRLSVHQKKGSWLFPEPPSLKYVVTKICSPKLLNSLPFVVRSANSVDRLKPNDLFMLKGMLLMLLCPYVLLNFDKKWWFWKVLHKLLLSGSFLICSPPALNARVFFVSIHNLKSQEFQILSGVPQRSILGPLLFNLCMILLSKIVKNHILFKRK